jgi:hypothetical protein
MDLMKLAKAFVFTVGAVIIAKKIPGLRDYL